MNLNSCSIRFLKPSSLERCPRIWLLPVTIANGGFFFEYDFKHGASCYSAIKVVTTNETLGILRRIYFFCCHCSGEKNLPSRLIYSTCLTADIFVPLGFLSDLIRKWYIAKKDFPPFISQPQVSLRLANFFSHFFASRHGIFCISRSEMHKWTFRQHIETGSLRNERK